MVLPVEKEVHSFFRDTFMKCGGQQINFSYIFINIPAFLF